MDRAPYINIIIPKLDEPVQRTRVNGVKTGIDIITILLCRSAGNGPRPSHRPRGPSQKIQPSAPPSCMQVNRNITYNIINYNDDEDDDRVMKSCVRRSLLASEAE